MKVQSFHMDCSWFY